MCRTGLLAITALVTAMVLSACPAFWNSTKLPTEASPQELFKEAEQYYKNKDYQKAIETYEQLKSGHPDFEQMPAVWVKIGDALYASGYYDRAISRYLQFAELYPNHPYVPRAKYYVGMAHFQQIKGTDLDNALLQRAATSFKLLANDPRGGKWTKLAAEKYDECRKKLAEKEIYKARTYMSLKNYRAARIAAKRVLDEYPKLGFDEQAEAIVKAADSK